MNVAGLPLKKNNPAAGSPLIVHEPFTLTPEPVAIASSKTEMVPDAGRV